MQKQSFIFLGLLSVLFVKINLGQILPFHNYTMKDGLISDNIQSICQDSIGFIWIGIINGVIKINEDSFSNEKVTKYNVDNGLLENNIPSLLVEY